MKILTLLVLLVLTINVGAAAVPAVINLTETNHATLIGEVEPDSITKVILKLNSIKEETAYLFIDSPGGSVLAGHVLIEYFSTSKKNIVCVAKMAISMAHQILQACPHRVGMTTNILMQHRMTAGVQGNPDNMAGLLSVLTKMEIQLNTMSAKRIGVSIDEFFKKVSKEWWTFGSESKKLNIVDDIRHVSCDATLYAKETKANVQIMVFTVPVIISGCPLIPVRIDESAKRLDKKIQEAALALFTVFPRAVEKQ